MRILRLLPALLLLSAVSVNAQEKPAAPFTWTAEGDTADTFTVSVQPSIEIDRSSPEALVKSFLALSDGRDEALRSLKSLDAKIDVIEQSELKEALGMLDESLRGLPLPAAQSETFGGAWEVKVIDPKNARIIEFDDEGKRVMPRPDERSVTVTPNKADGVPTDRHRRYEFRCWPEENDKKLWQIAYIQGSYEFGTATATFGSPYEPPETLDQLRRWLPTHYDPRFDLAAQWAFDLEHCAVAFDGEVHSAVQAFCRGLLLKRMTVRTKLVLAVLRAHIAAVEPLLAPEFVKQLKGEDTDHARSATPLNHEFRTFKQLETRDLGGGRIGVVIEKDDLHKTSWLFELTPDGDDWRIAAIKQRFTATRVRDGKVIETLRKINSFWDAAKQDVPSVQTTPIFMK